MKTIDSIKDLIFNKKITVEKLIEKVFDDIETRDKDIHAFLTLTKDKALEKAIYLDKKLKNGESLGKLFGIPIAIKDNINVKNEKMTCASKILENFISPYDATVIEKLEKEDAIIIGKTNLDEFAMGSSTETSYFGITKNPLDLSRVPGGSSGGSAASVAAEFVPVALGSDTGGSIRQPASFCGVLGLKPTYGSVSRYGLVAFASSLDQIGPFTNSTDDMAIVLNIISGYDEKDSTSINKIVPNFIKEIKNIDIKGKKIGIPVEFYKEGLDKEIKGKIFEKISILEKNGAIIKDISLPHTEYSVSTYYIIASSEASANLARFDGVKYGFIEKNIKNLLEEYTKTRSIGFGNEVKRRIMLGTFSLSSGYYDAYYKKAQKVRNLIKEDFVSAFKDVDFIITPTSPTVAFKIGEKVSNPLSMYLSDIYTISVNLAGIPAISLPIGNNSDSMPIGMQIIGNYFKELDLLKISKFLETNKN